MEKLSASMYDPKDLSGSPAIRHGNTYESVALKKFSEITGKNITKSGLCVDPELPYLGATPDGFVQDEDAIVEVKSPYVARRKKITSVTRKHFAFLEEVDGKMRLKRNHQYFFQIMGQMRLSKKSHGYFIVYTFEDLFYEKIDLDNELFNNVMLPKLKNFYDQEYCPYIASCLEKK